MLVDASAAAERPWVVSHDEQSPADVGVLPDAEDPQHDVVRREALWPTLFAQGGGCEWYFGYDHPHSDLDCEDFRTRDNLWVLTQRALEFMHAHVPFEDMGHADSLAIGTGPSVLAKRGEFYLVYLPFGGPVSLNLEGNTASFSVSWFDALNGGPLVDGVLTQVNGPGFRALGAPPGPGDWVAFVRRTTNYPPEIESLRLEPGTFSAGQDFSFQVRARDPNGPEDELVVLLELFDPNNVRMFLGEAVHRGGNLYSCFLEDAPALAAGTWRARVTVWDSAGLRTQDQTTFEAL
jgi:hypothetical protein